MIDARSRIIVPMEPTSEVETVCLTCLAKMVKNGIIIWWIVSVPKEQNGMELNVWLARVESHGSHLLVVFVLLATFSQALGVIRWMQLDVVWFLMLYGMELSAYVMMVSMLWGCNVFAMELWWLVDVIDVHISPTLSGDMVNADANQAIQISIPNA